MKSNKTPSDLPKKKSIAAEDSPANTITLYIQSPHTETINLFEDSEQNYYEQFSERKDFHDSPPVTDPFPPIHHHSDQIDIGEKLGEGGMGVVYIGHQKLPERHVAVKMLKSNNIVLARALLHEAMMTGALEHPNIIPIHSVKITSGNSPEVVMKRVHGKSLSEKIHAKKTEDNKLRNLLNIILQVCRPLEFAHSRGIIHRDIKPENIMMGKFGEVYLLDWGLAVDLNKRDRLPKGVVGTPAYMAPEMTHGDPLLIDHRTDIYLLGATLHELLTGKRRHPATTISEAIEQSKLSEPYKYDPGILAELGDLANESCALKKSDRPQSVEDFRKRLEGILQHWEALRISQASSDKLQQLKDLSSRSRATPQMNIKVHQLFGQARFGFEQALSIYPKCTTAKNALQESLEIMIEIMSDTGQFDYARSLLGSLPRHKKELEIYLNTQIQKNAQREEEAQRIKQIAANYDRSTSSRGRKLVATAISVASLLVVVLVMIYDHLYQPTITPQRLLVTTGSVALTAILFIFLTRKTMFSNAVGQRLATSIGTGAVGLIVVAFSGYQLQISANYLMLLDITLVAIAFSNAYPSIRNGLLIGVGSLILAILTIFNPRWAHTCLMLSAIIASWGTLFDWYQEEQSSSQ